MEMNFFLCEHCGNLATLIEDSGVPMVCCGEKMTKLTANTVDAAREKHVPVVTQEGNQINVQVGSTLHPMSKEHLIEWIALHTEQGCQLKYLNPEIQPIANFALADGDKLLAVYEYCNLHGLWKA